MVRQDFKLIFTVISSVLILINFGCNDKGDSNDLKKSLNEHKNELETVTIDTVINVRKYKSNEKKILTDKIEYNIEGRQEGEIITYNVNEKPNLCILNSFKRIVNSKKGELDSWAYSYHENGSIRRLSYYKDNKSVNNISVDGDGYIYDFNSSRTRKFRDTALNCNMLDSLIRNDFPEGALAELNWMYIKLNY